MQLKRCINQILITTATPLMDAEKSEIEAEVRAIFDTIVEGINEHDVDKILGSFLKSDQVRYAGGGTMFSGWQTLHEGASTWHADPANQASSFTMDEVIVDVLSREIAILTARGTETNMDENGNPVQRGYTVTHVLQHRTAGWVIINLHESESDWTGTDTSVEGT